MVAAGATFCRLGNIPVELDTFGVIPVEQALFTKFMASVDSVLGWKKVVLGHSASLRPDFRQQVL